ncbi:glycosyltransferase family 4 protein [Heyndrickxia coagulans]|uniref:glycosyltransferase family 4 protein n=1 Tax=Heyndrickxia coagulans TaxID=1398 RepID=UPI003D1D8115
MEKRKLVYICEALGGGVRKHLIDVLKEIDRDKFEIFLIYSPIRADKVFMHELKSIIDSGVKCYSVKMSRNISLIDDMKAFILIYKILKQIKPNIVHCHSSKAGALGRLAGFFLGVEKIYYTPHAYIMQKPGVFYLKKMIFLIIEKLLGKITTKTINVSNGEREFALKNKIVGKENSITIYNGINPPLIQKSRKVKKNIVIGTIARMDDQKDPMTFYKIAKEIVCSYPNVEFWYVGDGPLKHLIENQVIEEGLEDQIKLLGFQDNVNKYLSDFDIFITTSLYEGLPYSLIEALSLGLPIIATDIIGNNEIVKDNKNGFLFNIYDVEMAVEKISKLIHNEPLINRFSKESSLYFHKNFLLKDMIISLEKLYES